MALSNTLRRLWLQKRWGKIAAKTPLSPLYTQDWQPEKTPLHALRFLVLDCEMTGLNPQRDALLSLGWVRIDKGEIDYASRRHVLVHAKKDVGDSVVIHGLEDRQIAGAASPSRALSQLAQDIRDSVVVFHHAVLDLAFLRAAALHHFACPFLFQYVDTMQIERRILDRSGQSGALQLSQCRGRYGLPAANAHNAMFDAIATAELLLAQLSYLDRKGASLASLGPSVV